MRPDFIPFSTDASIRVLTMLSLAGLLLAIGVRLDFPLVVKAIKNSRLPLILFANFILIPALATALAWVFSLPDELAAGMLLLAAAPFAPVVPVFVKMAGGDLALAAGLTAIFPVFSTFLTPLVFEASLSGGSFAGYSGSLHFFPTRILGILSAAVTLPLLLGMLLRQITPAYANKILSPLEKLAETAGAISLAFVTYVEFEKIVATGWKSMLAMIVAGEISFLLGLAIGGPWASGRQAIAFGTANRNIALALLIAVQSFAGTSVVAAVVVNGLLLIFLGLLHVAVYRLTRLKLIQP